MRGSLASTLVLVSFGVFGLLACSVPKDTDEYEYAGNDVSAGSALGLACSADEDCGSELRCLLPSECRIDPDTPYDEEGSGGTTGARCEDALPCRGGYVCTAVVEVARCARACASDEDCPLGASCWTERGAAEGLCVPPGGWVGDPCALETDCIHGLGCENRVQGGYCTRACGLDEPCPYGMGALCVRLSGGAGNACLTSCEPGEDDCASEVDCTKMTESAGHVCFPRF